MEERWNFHRYRAVERIFVEDGPPIEMTVAQVLGYKPPVKVADQPDFEQFMQAVAPGGWG